MIKHDTTPYTVRGRGTVRGAIGRRNAIMTGRDIVHATGTPATVECNGRVVARIVWGIGNRTRTVKG